MKFGTRFAMPRRVTLLERLEDGAFCATFDNAAVRGRAVIVAAGVQYSRLPIERPSSFEARRWHLLRRDRDGGARL